MNRTYKDLANDIVKQVCDDYVESQLKLMGIKTVRSDSGEVIYKKRTNELSERGVVQERRMVIECLNFLTSDWCERLYPSMDGVKIVEHLNEQVKNIVDKFNKIEEERIKNLKKRGPKEGSRKGIKQHETEK